MSSYFSQSAVAPLVPLPSPEEATITAAILKGNSEWVFHSTKTPEVANVLTITSFFLLPRDRCGKELLRPPVLSIPAPFTFPLLSCLLLQDCHFCLALLPLSPTLLFHCLHSMSIPQDLPLSHHASSAASATSLLTPILSFSLFFRTKWWWAGMPRFIKEGTASSP